MSRVDFCFWVGLLHVPLHGFNSASPLRRFNSIFPFMHPYVSPSRIQLHISPVWIQLHIPLHVSPYVSPSQIQLHVSPLWIQPHFLSCIPFMCPVYTSLPLCSSLLYITRFSMYTSQRTLLYALFLMYSASLRALLNVLVFHFST